MIPYDKCFAATGATARTLSCPGSDLRNIFCLRVAEEASSILGAVEKTSKLVIVGSSFIGMETAAFFVDKAASIDVIGLEKVPFERILGAEIGLALQRFHESKGVVRFHMMRVVSEFEGRDGRVAGVLLDNGVLLPADVVVMGAGVVPSTNVFKGVAKERDASIIVDKHLCATADGSLYCGGDIARYPYHRTNNSLVRIEHLGMAQFHGKLAARNMMGRPAPNTSIPFFWTTAHGKSLRYCGHAVKYDQIFIDGDGFYLLPFCLVHSFIPGYLEKLEFVAFFSFEGSEKGYVISFA